MISINKYIHEAIAEKTLSIPENWELIEVGPTTAKTKKSSNKYDWVFYEGGNDWQPAYMYLAVFTQEKYSKQNEVCRIWMEVKYPSKIEPDKEGGGDSQDLQKEQTNFGEMIAYTWIKKAKALRREHVQDNTKYHKTLDDENDKMDKADKRGEHYERQLPDNIKFDGNWTDAFVMALKDPSMKPFVEQWGIDRTDWKTSSDIDYKKYE